MKLTVFDEQSSFRIDYSGLNPEQREAVFSSNPRILCLAGAGTGKTQVLTRRVAQLWEMGVSTKDMLALTFTRAAGAEMKERVIGLIGTDGKGLFCNTFHAFCVEVIREHAECLGYEPSFSIYTQPECDELLAEILTDLRYKIPVKRVNEYRAKKTGSMTASDRKQAERAAKEYEYRLKRNNALDFDGLINTVKQAVSEYPEICESLRYRYRYVFVDEFQDTDAEQWEIVKSLNPQNLFVVGDDFQSIYGFRGSDISIILELAKSPEWQTVKLERNYRSTLPIIAAANMLIKHNKQTEKKLTTEKPGEPIIYREPEDDEAEISGILDQLASNQQPENYKTTVILARTNRQLDRAKAILTAHDVPCEKTTATDNPMASKGARELLAWIAAIVNPQDESAIRKIAAAKMSKVAVLNAEKAQLESNGTFSDALLSTEAGTQFMKYLDEQSQAFNETADLTISVSRLIINLGIDDYGVTSEISKWQQRQIELGEPATALNLLEYIRLGDITDKSTKERDASKTYLMTVHGSKGLEFEDVYIIGAAQGVFPNRGNIEEERRLFYVAITRARERLNISCPLAIADWSGSMSATERSQFVSEAMSV